MTDESTNNEQSTEATNSNAEAENAPQQEQREEPVSVQEYQAEVSRLRDELKNVREEAAGRRVELKNVRDELQNAKSLDEFQALETKYRELEEQRQHEQLIHQHARSLPDELRESVTWPKDEDGIKSLAQKLSRFAVMEYDNNPSGGLGPRGQGGDEEFDPAALVAHLPR